MDYIVVAILIGAIGFFIFKARKSSNFSENKQRVTEVDIALGNQELKQTVKHATRKGPYLDLVGLKNELKSQYGFQRATALDQLAKAVEIQLIDRKNAAKIAIPLLNNDPDDAVREAAVAVLQQAIDDSDFLDSLKHALVHDKSLNVKMTILKAFGQWWGISRREGEIVSDIAKVAVNCQENHVKERAANELKGMLQFNDLASIEGAKIRESIKSVGGDDFLLQLERQVLEDKKDGDGNNINSEEKTKPVCVICGKPTKVFGNELGIKMFAMSHATPPDIDGSEIFLVCPTCYSEGNLGTMGLCQKIVDKTTAEQRAERVFQKN